jgi:carboxypeptidase Q
MSGHMDSWDNGLGAMDDGQGWACGWAAMEVIQRLTSQSGGGRGAERAALPPPKRTIRTIHWAAEEWGSQGAADYWTRWGTLGLRYNTPRGAAAGTQCVIV